MDRTDPPAQAKTNLEGTELTLPAGKYEISSVEGIPFDGKEYRWNQTVDIAAATTVELSNDNAVATPMAAAPKPTHVVDELTNQFMRLKNSVVTVWGETGRGTGFIMDDAGLVLTNDHVVNGSSFVSVQFDEQRKVRATVLASNSESDIAVLRIASTAFSGSIVAPIAKATADQPAVVEGERVFTIGSPLNQRKIVTSGIVSEIEPRAIISDVNINHGNSGGPLFNSIGEVVGITTFDDLSTAGGPGISGIIRIEQAAPLLAAAKEKLSAPAPDARLLPVEPTSPFPLDAIKAAIMADKFNLKPYTYGIAGFDVAFGTPVINYRLRAQAEVDAAKQKKSRNRRSAHWHRHRSGCRLSLTVDDGGTAEVHSERFEGAGLQLDLCGCDRGDVANIFAALA